MLFPNLDLATTFAQLAWFPIRVITPLVMFVKCLVGEKSQVRPVSKRNTYMI